MVELDIPNCSRRCSVTGRPLRPGEPYYSALVVERGRTRRLDYCPEAWPGPPEDAVGWWRAVVPTPESQRMRLAPHEVMIRWFEELAGDAAQADLRYVLGLLMLRRRILRVDQTARDERGREVMMVYCPRTEQAYALEVRPPEGERAERIQKELAELLFRDAA